MVKEKRISLTHLILTFAGLFLFLFLNVMTVRAEEEIPDEVLDKLNQAIDETIFLDNMGNLWFVSDDGKHHSKTRYGTNGFKITRCLAGTKTPVEEDFFIIKNSTEPDHTDYYTTASGEERVTSYWKLSEEEILGYIRGVSEEWYNEIIQENKSIYLKFDAIMMVKKTRIIDGFEFTINSGELTTISDDSDLVKIVNGQPVYEGYLFFTASDIQYNACDHNGVHVTWSAATDGFDSHFNKFFLYHPVHGMDEDIEIIGGNSVTPYTPDYWTWNESTSGDFDLSKGIPTSEYVTNHVQCDTWTGYYQYLTQQVTRNYSVSVNYEFNNLYYQIVSPLSTNYVRADKAFIKTIYTYEKKGEFNYLTGLSIGDLAEVKIYNEALSEDYVYYPDNNKIHIVATTVDAYGNEIDLTDASNSGFDLVRTLTEEALEYYIMDENITIPPVSKVISERLYADSIRKVEDVMKDYIENNINADDMLEDLIPDVITRSDTLIIDGITYMSGEYSDECEKSMSITEKDMTEMYAARNIQIPAKTPNGTYRTKIIAAYKEVVPNTANGYYVYESEYSDIKHVGNIKVNPIDYSKEPIVVHTPVISPIRIVREDDENLSCMYDNQMIYPISSTDYNLTLDTNYILRFNDYTHLDILGYGTSVDEYGNPLKYDKYTSAKFAKFPFTVRIGNDYYDENTWIRVGNETRFWVPTWAKETDNALIEIRVVAQNFTGDINFDLLDGVTESEANFNINNYIAAYSVACSMSGAVYDFQLTGISNADHYYWSAERRRENKSTRYRNTDYSFLENNEPKRVGNQNRFAEPYIRLLDGTLAKTWSIRDYLPLSRGSSHVWTNMGMLRKGDVFSFSLRTIGQYEDSMKDYIRIVPRYRLVEPDGTVHEMEDISLYYNDPANPKNLLIEYGTQRDRELYQYVNPSTDRMSCIFVQDYVENKLKWYASKGYMDATENYLRYNAIKSYCMSNILVPTNLMMYSGEEEQLRVNSKKEKEDIMDLSLSNTLRTKFNNSMQFWYGEYQVPMELFICDSDIDLLEYANNNNNDLSHAAGLWYKEGYLVLNFDIITVKDGIPHLTYYKGNCNMWEREGDREKVTILTNPVTEETVDIELRDGDVAIIDISTSYMDGYTAEYLFIN